MKRTEAVQREGTWSLVRRLLAAAPAKSRWVIGTGLATVVAGVGVQVVFDFSGLEPFEVAELTSVVLGMLGTFLFGLVHVLQEASRANETGASDGADTAPPREVLLALPALGFLAGSLLSVAIGILIVRSLARTPEILLVAIFFVALLVATGRTVIATGRVLYRAAHEQARAATEARGQLAEARLAALQARMNPHFLFNSLNTVASLVRRDPEAAEAMVENLSHVLRRTLDHTSRPLTSVEQEVDYVRTYLAVEQQRLRERLVVEWRLEERALPLALPTMTLQPLVENALKYAVAARLDGGRLVISAALVDGRLRVSVGDDGPGFPRRFREGTGLGNLRARLEALHGGAATLAIASGEAGTTVTIEVPADREPSCASEYSW